jgi:hypothetical protein
VLYGTKPNERAKGHAKPLAKRRAHSYAKGNEPGEPVNGPPRSPPDGRYRQLSLFDDIRSEVHGPGIQCGVAATLAILPPEDAADLEKAVGNKSIPATAIHRALRKRGIQVSDQSIGRHRRQGCQCHSLT